MTHEGGCRVALNGRKTGVEERIFQWLRAIFLAINCEKVALDSWTRQHPEPQILLRFVPRNRELHANIDLR